MQTQKVAGKKRLCYLSCLLSGDIYFHHLEFTYAKLICYRLASGFQLQQLLCRHTQLGQSPEYFPPLAWRRETTSVVSPLDKVSSHSLHCHNENNLGWRSPLETTPAQSKANWLPHCSRLPRACSKDGTPMASLGIPWRPSTTHCEEFIWISLAATCTFVLPFSPSSSYCAPPSRTWLFLPRTAARFPSDHCTSLPPLVLLVVGQRPGSTDALPVGTLTMSGHWKTSTTLSTDKPWQNTLSCPKVEGSQWEWLPPALVRDLVTQPLPSEFNHGMVPSVLPFLHCRSRIWSGIFSFKGQKSQDL